MADRTLTEYHERLAREARRDAEAAKRQAQEAFRLLRAAVEGPWLPHHLNEARALLAAHKGESNDD